MEIQSRFISNSEVNPIFDSIADLFQHAHRVDCAIAFLSFGGWQLLQPILNEWCQDGTRTFRLLVRKDEKFPDMRAVEAFNRFEGIDLRIFPSINFHAKQWIFYAADHVSVLTGSANMTRSGLVTNAEANVITRMPYHHPELTKIETQFQQWWTQGDIVPKVTYWKGVKVLMTLENMRFTLKDLSLDEVVWLREHHAKNSGHYEPVVSPAKAGRINDLQFSANITFKTWKPEVMTCLTEILQQITPNS